MCLFGPHPSHFNPISGTRLDSTHFPGQPRMDMGYSAGQSNVSHAILEIQARSAKQHVEFPPQTGRVVRSGSKKPKYTEAAKCEIVLRMRVGG